jgi:hypothetical protein
MKLIVNAAPAENFRTAKRVTMKYGNERLEGIPCANVECENRKEDFSQCCGLTTDRLCDEPFAKVCKNYTPEVRFISAKPGTLLLITALLICAGCTGPVPVKGGLSVLCWYNPRTYVAYGSAPTNTAASASGKVARDSNSQPVQPIQNGGVSVAIDNQTMYTAGGGTASSNTVPVSFSFNKE